MLNLFKFLLNSGSYICPAESIVDSAFRESVSNLSKQRVLNGHMNGFSHEEHEYHATEAMNKFERVYNQTKACASRLDSSANELSVILKNLSVN